MTLEISNSTTLSNDLQANLETVRRELPDTETTEDAVRTLAWKYARENENLRVELSGGIKHVEQQRDDSEDD